MSNRRFARAAFAPLQSLRRWSRKLLRMTFGWLFQTELKGRRKSRVQVAGFVLPTTVLLLLVVALTVGALLLRAGNRTNQVIGQVQQRVIYNAATPALDRARSKLEYLFNPQLDSRYPGGVPSERYLDGMLRNDGSYNVPSLLSGGSDPYTLPDETRVNLDGTQRSNPNNPSESEARPLDNAWTFRTDTNGDGTPDATVVYSVLLKTPPTAAGLLSNTDQQKVDNLWVRHGPLSNEQRATCNVKSAPEGGWFQDLSGTAILRKNFQVDALVIPDNANQSGNFTTIEFHQDRQLDRGNKWGAWFRNDLEISPGPPFNWNGAMHTEGSLIVTGNVTKYLVSAQNSCLMVNSSNSEISVTDIPASTNPGAPPRYTGLTTAASVRDNAYGGGVGVHVWPGTATGPSQTINLTDSNDSANGTNTPAEIALNPVRLLAEDVSQARGSDPTLQSNFQPNSGTTFLLPPGSADPRISNKPEPKPFVDDLYRADNRWGPKPRYSDAIVLSGVNQRFGQPINAGSVSRPEHLAQLTSTPNVVGGDQVGLDGYWERRARLEGLRVIVGQRLELGNPFGFDNDGTTVNVGSDPLYPPNTAPASRQHETRQRKALRDNLAAVQATAIYHHANPGGLDFPVACLASTAHPGTDRTIQDSIDFTGGVGTAPRIDFFNGRGTNGWEFAPPQTNESAFASAVDTPTSPLGKALRNLASFAGDDNPATPGVYEGSFPPVQDNQVHPYPTLTMWGNFSELRRIFASGTTYANLSPSDKTYLHTAACTLGMLAHNLQTIYDRAAATGATPTELELRSQIDRDREFGFIANQQSTAFPNATANNPKYPALFYLFPKAQHGHNTNQPSTNPFVNDSYINTINGAVQYEVVGATVDDFNAVALTPRATDFSDWVLPNLAPVNTTGANVSSNPITAPGGSRAVGFLDRVIMNGREMMPTRVMDLDVGMLRSNGIAGQPWLPVSGIVYAFREDAVREDGIARPAAGTVDIASGAISNPTDVTNPAAPTDPPLATPANGLQVSVKGVDYVPDPDRRPHGFRLRNGAQVKRNDSFGIPAADNSRGITFVSDTTAYIQGDFNLHQTGGDDSVGTRLEEFTQLLPAGLYNNGDFYGRTTLDSNFAQVGAGQDRWRPSEILADAVTILSNNFVDGDLTQVFDGCSSATSFCNFNSPTGRTTGWIREDGTTTSTNLPVKIDRNGNPLFDNGGTPDPHPVGSFQGFNAGKSLVRATPTRVNAVVVSGLVPSREGQYYGGLHNFPRFLEDWDQVPLYFAGSFLQLNFSQYATAPYDQDAWELGATSSTAAESIRYYRPPNRLWGYDPGLQLAPAGPVAARFVTLSRRRTEFYKELPVNDPYIKKLCEAARTSGIQQVANLNCPA